MKTFTKFLIVFTTLGWLAAALFAQQGKTRAEAVAREYRPLPETVERRHVTIWSDGTKMAGDLYLPAGLEPEDKLPAIVFIAGTSGTKKGTPARMAPLFVGSGYNAVEAAEKITVPMLIIDAENEELMDPAKNGKLVAEILEANGTPVKYHVLEGISHYGIYRKKFQEATAMEIEWFDRHLKAEAPN